jgi:uncharacterized membrane protein/uncharacterized membrane protein YbhN (UPF0104 family)
MKLPWRRILQAVVLLVAFGFLFAALVTQWQALQAYEWRIQPRWVLLALAGLSLGWLAQVGLWRCLLQALGATISLGQTIRVWFLSNVSRYIPGSVWQFLSMTEMAADAGVSRVSTLTSILLHQVISLAAGLALAAPYLAWAGEVGWMARLRPLLWAVPLGLLLLHPRILERALNWGLARFHRPPLQISLAWRQIWALLLGHALAWVVIGASFAALVQALTPVSWSQVPVLIAVFAASYVIGFLSLITPSGLGVREGVMVLLLAPAFSTGVAAVVAIVSRLWMVAAEVIGAGLVLGTGLIKRWQSRRGPIAGPPPLVATVPSTEAHADTSGGMTQPQASAAPCGAIDAKPAGRTGTLSVPSLLLVLLILAYTVGFSVLSIRLHEAQLTHKADLGQIDLAIWNTSRGRFVQEVRGDSLSTRLTSHVEPIFAPVSLLFWLWDDVRALLVLQSFALAIGALPLFWLARARLGYSIHEKRPLPPHARSVALRTLNYGPATPNVELRTQDSASWVALLFAFVYLLFPAMQAANLTEFHAIPLAVPLILFAFWFAERERWILFAAACLLLMAVKEEAALLAFMLGAYVVVRSLLCARFLHHAAGQAGQGTRRASRCAPLIAGACVIIVSLAWFYVATFVIIPRYAATVYADAASIYFQRYGELGNSVSDILRSLITRPGLVWRTVTEPLRLRYVLVLLAPVGFLALLAPDVLILSSPVWLANALSSYAAQYSGAFHYSAPLVPYVVVAAVIGAGRLWRWLRSRLARRNSRPVTQRWAAVGLTLWLLGWSLGTQVANGHTPIGQEYRWPDVTEHHRLLSRFLAQVPPGEPASTTPPLYPHLSHREKLYQFPHLGDAEWVLLDVGGTTDMHPVELRDRVQQMLDSRQWSVTDAADGYLLLQRRQGSTALPDAFLNFTRAGARQPEHVVELTLGGQLRFLGYDTVDDERWRQTRVRTYWQAQRPLPEDLRVYPFFATEDGSVAEDTTQRPPVAPLWYPPASWATGEVIVVETLPWYLPPRWGLAIGAVQGDTWEQRDARWVISDSEGCPVHEDNTWALVGVFARVGGRLMAQPVHSPDGPAVPVPADFANGLQLLGHDGLPEEVAAGSDLSLTLHWRAEQSPDADYTIFVHLRDDTGRTSTQADAQPTWYGPQPMSGWMPGQPVLSAHTLPLDGDMPPGQYHLVLGVYDWRTMERLSTLSKDGQPVGDEVELAAIRVGAPEKGPTDDLCCALIPECCISVEQ